MASRQNRESRDEIPTYGAPMGPPKASGDAKERRARERREKLETKATPEERSKLIEEHEAQGRAETVERRRDRRTAAPKPKPDSTTVTETEGKSTIEILRGRGRDIEDTMTELEGGERPKRETDAAKQRREEREREEKGGGRPRPIGSPVGGPTRR